MAVAAQIGCGFCLDIDYFQALNRGLDMTKASQVPCWRSSEEFTPLERRVLEYAEAMTDTPPTVTDELSGQLLDQLGPAAMIELTAFIAFSKFAARANVGVRNRVAGPRRPVPDPVGNAHGAVCSVDRVTEVTFGAHRGLLFTVAYEMLGSAADAEDVLQESWLRWAGVDHTRCTTLVRTSYGS